MIKVIKKYQWSSGFSLIELLIAVAIVAILASVAYPSYQAYVKKSHRATSQTDFVRFSQAMEKAYVTKFTYKGLAGTSGAPADTGTPQPEIFSGQIPVDSNAKYYNVTIDTADNTTFSVLATPIAGSLLAGDGRLTINNRGDRCWFENEDVDDGDDTTNPCIEF